MTSQSFYGWACFFHNFLWLIKQYSRFNRRDTNGMQTIYQIYKRDLSKIKANKVLWILMLGLILVPALYSWISIDANWDPYGNTKNLKVAIVNNDEGTEFKNTKINIGNEVISKLKDNENIGWTFVSQKEAEAGVKYGKYYASIMIPEDFTEDLLSIVTQSAPTKATLVYSVNEKINAIAPKITKSGLTSLQNEIISSFTQEAANTILTYMNAYGYQLEQVKSDLDQFFNTTGNSQSILPLVGQEIQSAYELANDTHAYVENLQKSMPLLSNALDHYTNIATATNYSMAVVNQSMKNLPDQINANLTSSKNRLDAVSATLNKLQNSVQSGSQTNIQSLQSVSDKLNLIRVSLVNNITILEALNKILNSTALSNFIDNQQYISNQISSEISTINNLTAALKSGQVVSANAIQDSLQNLKDVSNRITIESDNFKQNIVPLISAVMNNALGASDNTLLLLKNAKSNLPLINNLLKDAEISTHLGATQLKNVYDGYLNIQNRLDDGLRNIKALNEDAQFNRIINLILTNPKAISDFLSNPIELKQNRIYPIPNYGSAMTPFYTTLAIWVSAITALSLLSVNVEPFENCLGCTIRRQFMGRYLTFATLSVLQAFVVATGNLVLLGAYAKNPVIFLLFSLYVGLVFHMIVYTLVSVLGNVGKAASLIIMVLQVSASGGTFPIQLTPRLFQNISPLLPFTYAIGGMREAQGGIIWSILWKNIGILSIYFFLFIMIGFFFKEKINRLSERFISKAKESGLVGE